MNNMPLKLRKQCARDPRYKTCMRNEALHDHECAPDPLTGRMIEWEHAMIYAGKQIQLRWAVISSCWWAHRGPGLNKEINEWIAINRAEDHELLAISKAEDYFQVRSVLNRKYGVYREHTYEPEAPTQNGINYQPRLQSHYSILV